MLQELRLNPTLVPDHTFEDGIEAARQTIPVARFNRSRCKDGIEALRMYRREWDDKRKTFRERPLHDWSSHGADAFGEFAVNYSKAVAKSSIPRRARIGTMA